MPPTASHRGVVLLLDHGQGRQVAVDDDVLLGLVGELRLEVLDPLRGLLVGRVREGLHLPVGLALLHRHGEGRDVDQLALVEVGAVLAGELQVVLGEGTADEREHAGARRAHGRLDLEQLSVQVDELDLQAADAALGVAPTGECLRRVPELLVEPRPDGGALVVGHTDVELVGPLATLAVLDHEVAGAARGLEAAPRGGGVGDGGGGLAALGLLAAALLVTRSAARTRQHGDDGEQDERSLHFAFPPGNRSTHETLGPARPMMC